MSKAANIKELAERMGVDARKLRSTLLEIGLGVLQSEAERKLACENWDKKDFLVGTANAPSISHFKAAWDEISG